MIRLFFTYLLALIAITACQKDFLEASSSGQEIILSVEGSEMDTYPATKVTAETSVPSSLYFAGTTGTSTQTSKWAPSSTKKTVSSGKISTGYYQTATPTAYNYYLSNRSMTFTTSGCTISASGLLYDVVVGIAKGSKSASPTIELKHIFARTGEVNVTSTNGYTLSNLYVYIQSNTGGGTGGTYNIYTGQWSDISAGSEMNLDSSSDRYLIPGSYKITVSCKRTKGTFSDTFNGSVDVTLYEGYINNISISLTGDPAVPIKASTSITPWGTTTLSGTPS